ncbi:hypothetical protein NHQ30_001637 [Ciborinia camelliae]|nr:hypothetical protein NHQ30_001637 [Ciborinia camelliae]
MTEPSGALPIVDTSARSTSSFDALIPEVRKNEIDAPKKVILDIVGYCYLNPLEKVMPLCMHQLEESDADFLRESSEFDSYTTPSRDSKANLPTDDWQMDPKGRWPGISLLCDRCEKSYSRRSEDHKYFVAAVIRQYWSSIGGDLALMGREVARDLIWVAMSCFFDENGDKKEPPEFYKDIIENEKQRQEAIKQALREYADKEKAEVKEKEEVRELNEYRYSAWLARHREWSVENLKQWRSAADLWWIYLKGDPTLTEPSERQAPSTPDSNDIMQDDMGGSDPARSPASMDGGPKYASPTRSL